MTDRLLILKETIAEILVESLKMNLIANDRPPYPNSLRESNLYESISYVIEGDNVSISIPSYAIFVDQGRRPGKFPNITAIERWILRKFTSTQLRNILDSPGGLNTVVFLIARSIARNGIRPKPFIEQSINDLVGSQRFDIALNGFIDEELIRIFLI